MPFVLKKQQYIKIYFVPTPSDEGEKEVAWYTLAMHAAIVSTLPGIH